MQYVYTLKSLNNPFQVKIPKADHASTHHLSISGQFLYRSKIYELIFLFNLSPADVIITNTHRSLNF